MEAYMFPIKTALLTFPFIAFLVTFPFVIYQYRKYGYVNKFRCFMLYSFLLYGLTSYYLVILPLPKTFDIKSLQKEGTEYFQLIPFNFITCFLKESNLVFSEPSTYINIFKERAFLQAAFNGILLTPLGIYLRYYFKKDFKRTVVIALLVSLFFEITQITGLYGIYNAPYRIFDVDDLILNTLGGCIGYTIAPIFMYFLPNTDKLDESVDLKGMSVGYFRRCFAFVLDWTMLKLVSGIITSFFDLKKGLLVQAVIVLIYFILILYFTNGKTFGKWLLRIKVQGQKEKLLLKEVFVRYGILYYGIFGINTLLSMVISLNKNNQFQYIINVVMMLVLLIFNTMIFIHVVIHLLKKDKRLFYEKISKTKVVIDIKK